MSAPQPPIRKLLFRLDRKSGRFVPCTGEDSRGTLTANVDATGRNVMAIYPTGIGDYRLLGWKYPPGVDSPGAHSWDPARVVEWMQAHPDIRLVER